MCLQVALIDAMTGELLRRFTHHNIVQVPRARPEPVEKKYDSDGDTINDSDDSEYSDGICGMAVMVVDFAPNGKWLLTGSE